MSAEHRAEPAPRWQVPPLRSIEGDVPVPFTVEAADHTVSVGLNIGQTVLIRQDGAVFNADGTELFRLVRAERTGEE